MDIEDCIIEMIGRYDFKVVEGDPAYNPVNLENNYYWKCIECNEDKNFSAFRTDSCEECEECYKKNQMKRDKSKREAFNRAFNRLPKVEGTYHIINIKYDDEFGVKDMKYLYKYSGGRWRKVV